MRDHVRFLTQRRLPAGLVIEWLKSRRTHEHDYPVLLCGAPCPRCGALSENRTAIRPVQLPGGLGRAVHRLPRDTRVTDRAKRSPVVRPS
jgi:hypothetical protein